MAQASTGDRAALAYRARPQQVALHLDRTRFKVIVAHRRFGKTVFAILQLLLGAMENERRAARYAYVAPFYRQAKAVALPQALWRPARRRALP
jgi:phage terminase large subunit